MFYVCLIQKIMHLVSVQYTSAYIPPGQNDRHFTNDTFKGTLMNKKIFTSIRISLKFVRKGPMDNAAALVEVMAWLGIEQLISR